MRTLPTSSAQDLEICGQSGLLGDDVKAREARGLEGAARVTEPEGVGDRDRAGFVAAEEGEHHSAAFVVAVSQAYETIQG